MKTQDERLTIPQAIERAYAHWEAGQAQQAEILARRVLEVEPNRIECLHLLGLLAHAYQKPEMALGFMRKACASPRAPGIYFSNLAEMCRQQGLLGEAEKTARIAVERAPDLTGAWNNLGIILQETGNLHDALSCLEKVTALEPENHEAYNNLANTLLLRNRFDDARRQYDKAIELHPRYAEAHSNLANLLCKLGEYAAAARHAQKAIDINPHLIDAYTNFADIELAQQRLPAALQKIDALMQFAPDHPSGLIARAKILNRQDRLEEARDAAQQAVDRAPENAAAHKILGEVLGNLDMYDAALASLTRAGDLPGKERLDARRSKVSLLTQRGEREQAQETILEILEEDPDDVFAWAKIADIRKFAERDRKDVDRLEGLLTHPNKQLPADHITALYFTLGKMHLDLGDAGRAFGFLNEGNRRKRATLTYDSAFTVDWMTDIARIFSRDRIEMLKSGGHSSTRPLFIFGMPRSGTTLIEQILGSHPLIAPAGELYFVQRLADQIAPFPGKVETLDPARIEELAEAYLSLVETRAKEGAYVTDKMPANFLYAGLIHAMFPEAILVHCRRNPVDTCLSCYSKIFSAEQPFTYDMTELGAFYRAYERLMGHWRAILPSDRFIEIDYEDVVDDLEGQARRLTDFVGIPWNEACLNFHENKRTVRTASQSQVHRPIYTTSRGRWKQYADYLQPLLEALGEKT